MPPHCSTHFLPSRARDQRSGSFSQCGTGRRSAGGAGLGLQVLQQVGGINTVMYYTPAILELAGVGDKRTALLLALVPAGARSSPSLPLWPITRSVPCRSPLPFLRPCVFWLFSRSRLPPSSFPSPSLRGLFKTLLAPPPRPLHSCRLYLLECPIPITKETITHGKYRTPRSTSILIADSSFEDAWCPQ